jgi:hypothetical protein
MCPVLSKIEDRGHFIFRIMEDHPNLDLEQEFRNMRSWLDANPKRRPRTSQGTKKFCALWLNRNENKAKKKTRRDDY